MADGPKRRKPGSAIVFALKIPRGIEFRRIATRFGNSVFRISDIIEKRNSDRFGNVVHCERGCQSILRPRTAAGDADAAELAAIAGRIAVPIRAAGAVEVIQHTVGGDNAGFVGVGAINGAHAADG